MLLSLAIAAILALFPGIAHADFQRIPLYALTDWRYWVFLALYTAITVRIVQWVAAARKRSPALESGAGSSLTAAVIFAVAIFYQILHHFEHLTQFYQYWYLGMPSTISQGVLFWLDLEWNHFLFDSAYFVGLFIATLVFVRHEWQRGKRLDRFGAFLLLSMNLVQGWHAVEHTYRIVHHVQIGCSPCPGIIDTIFGIPLITLHFWFNVFALTLPLMAFWWFGMPERLGLHFGFKRGSAARPDTSLPA